jgi:predicted acetyltransferase
MNFELVLATEAEHDTLLRNLYQLYLYEFSRFTTEWRVQEDGRFPETDLEECWEDAHRRIFLIRSKDEWAGFAIVDLDLPDTDGSTVHELAEFFIMPPYRRHGMGENVARQLFDQYKGRWELAIVETNEDALHFWRTVLGRYTGNQFTERHRPEDEDFLHEFRSAA